MSMKNKIALLTPLLLMSLFGCASGTRLETAPESLHNTLQVLAERHHVCNVALAVVKNRKLDRIETAAACGPSRTPQPDAVFQAASLSKPVFAYAVLKLAAQGRLALDAPVVTYLPQGYRHRFDPFKADPAELVTDQRLRAITARMVLNHTAGLPNWASGPLYFDAAPGGGWRYSGEGYVLLQRAVEKITGLPLDRFMADYVFTPLGMENSGYVWEQRLASTLLPGSKANGKSRATVPLAEPNAAFSLYTTAADYGKFLVAVLNDEDLLRKISTSPVPVDPELDVGWGLGWGTAGTQDAPYIWQWGNNLGYRAFVMANTRSGDGLVMLTNSENGLKLAEPVSRAVLPGEHKLFRFSLLGDDIAVLLCNTLRVCF